MQDFLGAMVFSILLSISFGPVALIVLGQSITYGFRSALPGAFGAAVADAVFAAVAFIGLKSIEVFWLANSQLLMWAAIAYLFYLGVLTFKKTACAVATRRAAGFVAVFLVTLTSPFTIAAISSYAVASGAQLDGHGMYLNLLGVLIGSFLGQMLYVVGGEMIKRTLAGGLHLGWLNRVSGVCLIGFAAWQMGRVLVL
jgi:threonine/homoserine/homoserine lactone efflux protein